MQSDLGVQLTGGKTGMLLLHDVGGAAAELRAHAQAFARSGYSVSCPQLISLGAASGGDRGSAGKLVSEAEHALSRLKERCENVVIVGMGFGGMLALELARHNAAAVQAVVLVEPKACLPALPFSLPLRSSGMIKQTWVARWHAAVHRIGQYGGRAGPGRFFPAMSGVKAVQIAALHDVASLLDSVHAGLASIRQPVLLLHRPSSVRKGHDGSFLLQRRLGGRVESVMLEDVRPGNVRGAGQTHETSADDLSYRCVRFVSAIQDEIETQRGNELRRQRTAAAIAGRTDAA